MTIRERLRGLAFDVVRAFVYGIVILVILLGATALIGNTQEKLLSAIGCELGVPAINGIRDPIVLKACWTDEGLSPPAYFSEG